MTYLGVKRKNEIRSIAVKELSAMASSLEQVAQSLKTVKRDVIVDHVQDNWFKEDEDGYILPKDDSEKDVIEEKLLEIEDLYDWFDDLPEMKKQVLSALKIASSL